MSFLHWYQVAARAIMVPMPPSHQGPFGRDEALVLAEALGDAPKTAIPIHLLRRGLADAYVAGEISAFQGAIIQAHALPGEPTAFGRDESILWELLHPVPDWWCVETEPKVARGLGTIMARELDCRVRYLVDVHLALNEPVSRFRHPAVRLLTIEDTAMMMRAPSELHAVGFGSVETTLGEGVVSGAVVKGELVAVAATFAATDRYADVGVTTLEPLRGQGLSSAAASLVCEGIQARGRTPVWSTQEHNHASLRVAQKLGFTRVGELCYVIPERDQMG